MVAAVRFVGFFLHIVLSASYKMHKHSTHKYLHDQNIVRSKICATNQIRKYIQTSNFLYYKWI